MIRSLVLLMALLCSSANAQYTECGGCDSSVFLAGSQFTEGGSAGIITLPITLGVPDMVIDPVFTWGHGLCIVTGHPPFLDCIPGLPAGCDTDVRIKWDLPDFHVVSGLVSTFVSDGSYAPVAYHPDGSITINNVLDCGAQGDAINIEFQINNWVTGELFVVDLGVIFDCSDCDEIKSFAGMTAAEARRQLAALRGWSRLGLLDA